VFFALFALVSAGVGAAATLDAWSRARWPETEGRIASVTDASVRDVDVGYRYRVGGREVGAYERRRRTDELQPGRAVSVRYDPDRPETSTTRPAFAEWFSAAVAIAASGVVATFAALAFRAARPP
jgi:hypothetical protein